MRLSKSPPVRALRLVSLLGGLAAAWCFGQPLPLSADEAALFTPAGFEKEGHPAVATGPDVGQLSIRILDTVTGEPAFCRVNVVGADGNYYEPKTNYLTPYSLTGRWPETGKGNRVDKAPFRYYGRFFYSWGESEVAVPSGPVRVEVWKGFEYRPETLTTEVAAGQTRSITLKLEETLPVAEHGYWSGDPHIHITRSSDADESLILDLMEAEGIRYGSILAYNEPAGPYAGFMDRMDMPQDRGLGLRSLRTRGEFQIMSGQEYRSGTYGHLNLFQLDELVLKGESVNANDWPLYGTLGREAQRQGGYAVYAHGGYAQAIYADFVQGNVNGVELLQFGVYRGIGLEDWYRILNIGYRFPAVGACDYPACRKLGDCTTYVSHEGPPAFSDWLAGMSQGNSFVTTGPLLLLEVDEQKPGARIEKQGPGPHTVAARARVRCEVTPVTHVQLIANGRVVKELAVPPAQQQGSWISLEHPLEVTESTWIAARAYSLSPQGEPDAEAHTNPVYVYFDGKAPYDRDSLDRIVEKLDGQIALHKKRNFAEKGQVLSYFERSRDILMAIRAAGGVAAAGHPSEIVAKSALHLPDPSARTHSPEELAAFLKPLPPKPPAEALKTFETVGDMEMQLVAHEPLVVDPVAATFDEDGRLYVAEMRDYPYLPQPGETPLGTVRLLEDTDGDGVFDQSHVFADGLLWPAGLAVWKGGLYVAAPPDIWYMKDTDGDGKADERRKVYTGFGTQNQQGMLNNLAFGLDHRIYGSTSVNGGSVRKADDPNTEPIAVSGRDFRFDPVSGRFETITGTVQFGNTFDDWGNRFLCSESQPLLHAVLPQEYLVRNPFLPVQSAIDNIAPGPVPIFRISPTERWRMIRSSRRIAHGERSAEAAGASHHVIDAAAGVTVYRGGAYPAEYAGNVFVCDGQNNLIHRRTLSPNGVSFSSARADQQTEFVRSSDNWFRPVNLVHAPDGTLYVLDMSREILEAIHIPLDVVAHLDLKSGRDTGRIYRLAPPDFRSPEPLRLSGADIQELVAALESPHAWWRDTAHRLIYERQDAEAIEPLRKLLRKSERPQARLHALYSLVGLSALEDEDLFSALADSSPHLRAHGVRLSESRLSDPACLERVLPLAEDSELRVVFQVAFSLGAANDSRATAALAGIARRHAGDRWTRAAVLSSAADSADGMLTELLRDPSFVMGSAGAELADQLATIIGVRGRPEEVHRLLHALATQEGVEAGFQRRTVVSLGSGLQRSGKRLETANEMPASAADLLRDLFSTAERTALDNEAPEPARLQAVRLLSFTPFENARSVFAGLVETLQPRAVQVAAVRALAGYSDPEAARIMLRNWRRYVPDVRTEVVQGLLAREEATLAFLQAVDRGEAEITHVEPARRELLLQHRNPAVRGLAVKLFSAAEANSREQVVAAYRQVLGLDGDAALGEKVFEKTCMSCHRLAGKGEDIGPNLASSPAGDPDALLVHILDPNRYVLPKYVQYLVVDRNGRSSVGMIAEETATSITLKREKNQTETILTSEIEEMASMGKSLMPDELEKDISPQEMAHLLAFLRAARPEPAVEPPRLDVGTRPGLIEPVRSEPEASGR